MSRAKDGHLVTHVKALPGNPYDGHTQATAMPDIKALAGNTLDAFSETRDTAATTRRRITSSGSSSPARNGA
jgi:hypothetical protein